MVTPTLVLTLFWGSFLSSSHHRSTKQGETRLSQSQNTKYPLFLLASLRSTKQGGTRLSKSQNIIPQLFSSARLRSYFELVDQEADKRLWPDDCVQHWKESSSQEWCWKSLSEVLKGKTIHNWSADPALHTGPGQDCVQLCNKRGG